MRKLFIGIPALVVAAVLFYALLGYVNPSQTHSGVMPIPSASGVVTG